MIFLKKIWFRLIGFFIKRPPTIEKIILEEKAVLAEIIEQDVLFEQYKESSDDKEKADLIKKIAKYKTASKIIELINNDSQTIKANTKGRKRLYEFHELRAEIQILEEKKTILDFAASQINYAEYPETSILESKIDGLTILYKKWGKSGEIKLSDRPIISFDKIEKLLGDKSVLKIYRKREDDRVKQEELFKNQIKQKLSSLETLLKQNSLVEAKSAINFLSRSLKPNHQNELIRLNKAKVKLREKELQILKKQQEELLKVQEEEARKVKVLNEIRLEEIRLLREQQKLLEEKRREKEQEKKEKIQSLFVTKPNWTDYQTVLKDNNIETFYHFTDIANLKSIKNNGGLFSWHYSDTNGITIPYPGGDTLSRTLDRTYRLEDYIRLSFCDNHPMQFRLEQAGRNLILLKIDLEVAFWVNTRFSDINATDSNHKEGPTIEDLTRIKFSATKRTYLAKGDNDFKYHQAELLIKTHVPIKFITNINDF
jgi:hypothetical protein